MSSSFVSRCELPTIKTIDGGTYSTAPHKPLIYEPIGAASDGVSYLRAVWDGLLSCTPMSLGLQDERSATIRFGGEAAAMNESIVNLVRKLALIMDSITPIEAEFLRISNLAHEQQHVKDNFGKGLNEHRLMKDNALSLKGALLGNIENPQFFADDSVNRAISNIRRQKALISGMKEVRAYIRGIQTLRLLNAKSGVGNVDLIGLSALVAHALVSVRNKDQFYSLDSFLQNSANSLGYYSAFFLTLFGPGYFLPNSRSHVDIRRIIADSRYGGNIGGLDDLRRAAVQVIVEKATQFIGGNETAINNESLEILYSLTDKCRNEHLAAYQENLSKLPLD